MLHTRTEHGGAAERKGHTSSLVECSSWSGLPAKASPLLPSAIVQVLAKIFVATRNELRSDSSFHALHLHHYVPLTSPSGGANPHAADFPINIKATYIPGTIMEYLPQTTTFAQLMHIMRPDAPKNKLSALWQAQVKRLLEQAYPNHSIPT